MSYFGEFFRILILIPLGLGASGVLSTGGVSVLGLRTLILIPLGLGASGVLSTGGVSGVLTSGVSADIFSGFLKISKTY